MNSHHFSAGWNVLATLGPQPWSTTHETGISGNQRRLLTASHAFFEAFCPCETKHPKAPTNKQWLNLYTFVWVPSVANLCQDRCVFLNSWCFSIWCLVLFGIRMWPWYGLPSWGEENIPSEVGNLQTFTTGWVFLNKTSKRSVSRFVTLYCYCYYCGLSLLLINVESMFPFNFHDMIEGEMPWHWEHGRLIHETSVGGGEKHTAHGNPVLETTEARQTAKKHPRKKKK